MRASVIAIAGLVLAGCSGSTPVDGEFVRFDTGTAVEMASPNDAESITIVIAFDYLAADLLPDTRAADIDCVVSDGLTLFSMVRAESDEQEIGGDKVTPIMTIEARGSSGLLECQHLLSGREPLRAVVVRPRVD